MVCFWTLSTTKVKREFLMPWNRFERIAFYAEPGKLYSQSHHWYVQDGMIKL